MADVRRAPIDDPDAALSRDDQIDALIEDGLERYFSSRYEDAIHLWTRVLFLDRSHARARAYIDRARTALAEQHRRAEELLHASRELLNQGQTEAARRLLGEAMAARGDDVQAAALHAHLDRIERAGAATVEVFQAVHPPAEVIPGWSWRRTSRVPLLVGLGSVVVLAFAGVVYVNATDPGEAPPVRSLATAAPLPVPTQSEVALIRARTAFDRGRYSDALQKLDGVSAASPERAAADALRIEIQQLLLATVRSSSGSTPPEAIRR